jgi:hypothetical protein
MKINRDEDDDDVLPGLNRKINLVNKRKKTKCISCDNMKKVAYVLVMLMGLLFMCLLYKVNNGLRKITVDLHNENRYTLKNIEIINDEITAITKRLSNSEKIKSELNEHIKQLENNEINLQQIKMNHQHQKESLTNELKATSIVYNSHIINNESLLDNLRYYLNALVPDCSSRKYSFINLYIASMNGDAVETFITKVAGVDSIIILIEIENAVKFGVYLHKAIDLYTQTSDRQDANAFLFSLNKRQFMFLNRDVPVYSVGHGEMIRISDEFQIENGFLHGGIGICDGENDSVYDTVTLWYTDRAKYFRVVEMEVYTIKYSS